MNREFDDILSERIRELPSHQPSAALWKEIESLLDREDAILSQLHDLPIHHPSSAVWENIEAALQEERPDRSSDADFRSTVKRTLQMPPDSDDIMLTGKKRAGIRRRTLLMTIGSVAAAALILFAIPQLLPTEKGITVESEIIPGEEYGSPVTMTGADEDPIEVIRELCRTGAPICQSELFREKMQLYQELNEELRRLEMVIDQVGDSSEIIQSVIRIENLKSGTLQELIQLIHS